MAADTIEEKMEVFKEKKSALARSLFDDDGELTLAMTEADSELLLASSTSLALLNSRCEKPSMFTGLDTRAFP